MASEASVERGDFRLGPVTVQLDFADRVAITGPNGSGKTTLLGLLIGRDVKLVEYTTPHFSADLQFVLAEIPSCHPCSLRASRVPSASRPS